MGAEGLSIVAGLPPPVVMDYTPERVQWPVLFKGGNDMYKLWLVQMVPHTA